MIRPTPLFLVLVFLMAACKTLPAQWIVGHRGASFDAPENTVSAFRLAWDQGADAVEADFYLTSDDKIVCIHDADTERTTGVKHVVAQTPLETLRTLDAGSWKDERWRGEPVPTFEEVLAAIPDNKGFVIELKIGPEIVPVLEAEIKRLNAPRDRLIFISFKADTIAACKRAFPNMRAHWLTSFKQHAVTGEWQPTASEIARTVKECHADGVGMKGNREVIDREFIERLRHEGCGEFHVWTVDSPDDARYFKQLGAAAITTNRPQYIRETLDGQPAGTDDS
ncbi:glycerophosphodiester phosphodiesterase [Roseiconus nitratireducens]|uniref:Glycerophosphodiester phosphodiesterase n=1 Tax=Roseiconus nitratireducens TaxID=2605748 RepID=A0A5M6CYD3_9BACT|nr:glycerophosphodiester phosphodiesterase [Roseiconus nitratireducens]KAA5539430.1 glycerophosphodiester phosphodiesterase [Roseiconus nitratireducens]